MARESGLQMAKATWPSVLLGIPSSCIDTALQRSVLLLTISLGEVKDTYTLKMYDCRSNIFTL